MGGVKCPIFGKAKTHSECEVCHGDIYSCPIYGDTARYLDRKRMRAELLRDLTRLSQESPGGYR